MSDGRKKYFSLHGSEKEGWSLHMYQYVIQRKSDGTEIELNSVAPAWPAPKHFPTLREALAELCEHEAIE